MSQTGANFDETIDAWADITLKIWKQRMYALGFSKLSGHLIDSLPDHGFIERHSGGQSVRINFDFNYYGRMIDMGAGRGAHNGNREPKEWFSRNMYEQTMRLKEILSERYKDIAVNQIHEAIDNCFSENNALSQSTRNMINYQKRRTKAGRWTNNHKTWKPYNYREKQMLGIA